MNTDREVGAVLVSGLGTVAIRSVEDGVLVNVGERVKASGQITPAMLFLLHS